MADTYRVHLTGRGFSGRLVRYKILTPHELDQVEKLASGEMEKDSNVYDLNVAVARNGLERMIVAVSDPVKPEKAADAKWQTLSPADVSSQWSKLFTARDAVALRKLYQREHVVSEEEVDAIMSGKVPETD